MDDTSTKRPPIWSRDELIIALDFYCRHSPSIPDKRSNEIANLVDLINQMRRKLGGAAGSTCRNANAVYMKLMNFRRHDRQYEGMGLQRGSKGDEVVWRRFASNHAELAKVTESIQSLVVSEDPGPSEEVVSDEEEGEEGQVLTRTHRYRERDTRLVKRKKNRVLRRTGKLRCEVCCFDFSAVYGDRGDGFIECHHTRPLSELQPGQRTALSELALVCSNCHRMIHRKRPWLSVAQLREVVASQQH